MKISSQKIREIEKKRVELSRAMAELKKQFFGIDTILEQMEHSMEPWFLFPEASFRPYVINLWGMTGCGKTAVIRKLIELLGYEKRFLYFDMGGYGQNTKSNALNYFFDDDLNYLNNQPCIICLDEFQHLRTISEDFRETERPDIRVVWELIDTGKMEYTYTYGWSFIQEMNQLIQFLNLSLKNNVKVQNGVVINGNELFQKIVGEGASNYRFRFENNYKSNSDETEIKPTYFIPRSYYEDFYNLFADEYKNLFELEKHILSLNGNQSIEFLKNAIRKRNQPKVLDLSKALIFIVGNLDEAYVMSHDLNPDDDPDVLHEYSKGITIIEIKKELRKRFRLEQIARFGNNHLIYPSFDVQTFRQIIDFHLTNFKKRIKENFELEIDFRQSVYDIIYKEGVFPTQGARPLLTTINLLIDSYFSKVMGNIIRHRSEVTKLVWDYSDKKFNFQLYNFKDELIEELNYEVALQVESQRFSKQDDKQALIAVHESGHAIVSTLRTRILPREIISVTADSDSGGRYLSDLPKEIITKKYLMSLIETSLAGYVAEKLIFGENDTSHGVEQDLGKATAYASDLIKKFGMGDYRQRIGVDASDNDIIQQDKNHQLQIMNIINQCEKNVEELLRNNMKLLLEMANYLSVNNKMDSEKIREYIMTYSVEPWAISGQFIKKEEYYGYKRVLEEKLKETGK